MTEKDVIVPPDVATIIQKAGKKANVKSAHSFTVEQHRAMHSVSLVTRNTERIRLVIVSKNSSVEFLFREKPRDLKREENNIKDITMIPDLIGPSDFLLIIDNI